MNNKTFNRLFFAVLVLGTLSLVALTAYTIYLHDRCSIISYIANKG